MTESKEVGENLIKVEELTKEEKLTKEEELIKEEKLTKEKELIKEEKLTKEEELGEVGELGELGEVEAREAREVGEVGEVGEVAHKLTEEVGAIVSKISKPTIIKSDDQNDKLNEDLSNKKSKNHEFQYLINNELETVDNLELTEDHDDSSFEIKSRDSIYLEIYKNAKQKAKEIRKNAIEAFLEAKNIKAKYNLESLVNSDSSDDEEEIMLT